MLLPYAGKSEYTRNNLNDEQPRSGVSRSMQKCYVDTDFSGFLFLLTRKFTRPLKEALMQNAARGVGLSGLAALILLFAMVTQAAAVEVKTPSVQIQAPKIVVSPPPPNPQNPGKGVTIKPFTVQKQTDGASTPLFRNCAGCQ
jgi:hypothetical protein